ncbi:ABC transporter permease [Bordetella genomosp. 10]|uniref:ABC transporter permease n=1 Tax=Bordetella genomosp. 10 TaxID=1416804 RepID=A0A261S3W1_9BORD|nr:ABC transporter permease [Bordetella genomosp. 10]OZI32039.1 ABC transporter permease [Bordetella genomosp. 10]
MNTRSISTATRDIFSAFGRLSLVTILGWQDVRQRYRRSALGPFWLTISMGVMIGTIGIVFGQIFKSPMHEFLPFVAAGIILWGFVSSCVTEGCTGFISAEGIIKQLPIPLFVHILRMLWRNIIILGHNIVILPLIFLVVAKPVGWIALLTLPGFLLVTVNVAWVALILAVLCARYRDLPQIVASVLQVVFYLTPIMWMPSHLPARAALFLLNLNPCYHLLQVVRAPLLGEAPSSLNWIVAVLMAVGGWAIALAVYGRYKRRIAYWL